jgi:putative phosphoribosyl transferase
VGLPRGGVPVAYEVAVALGAPLDVWVARKLGAPFQPELGMGAIAEGGELYIDPRIARIAGATEVEVQRIAESEARELDRRVLRYRRGRPGPGVRGRTVIVVDDGIATGGTMRAVLRAIRSRAPKRLVLAVPVAAADTLDALKSEVDDAVCLDPSPFLRSIGEFYLDFNQVSDDEVVELLDRAEATSIRERVDKATTGIDRQVRIDLDGSTLLEGTLALPPGVRGLVLFAHGSGSSRHSPRNRFVAEVLSHEGLGTLLFDLLTPEEEEIDRLTAEYRFDVALLASRLVGVTDWLGREPMTGRLRVGYFGASTGAAAALIAAVQRPEIVRAVVSRGGRPDLASDVLAKVMVPTCFIVGSRDSAVLKLNEEAFAELRGPKNLAVVPGATHLFEEPGTLERAAALAADWFVKYLVPHRLAATG